jgi:hypothetical protein
MGKRMGGQLTISELAIMVTLGAIVSPAMQIPQLGVLMGVMILLCALIFQRGLNSAEFKSQKFEQLSQGTSGMVVKDGVILLEEMAKSKISQQQLFSALRGKDIYNLGQIGRVYFEACGIFSIFKKRSQCLVYRYFLQATKVLMASHKKLLRVLALVWFVGLSNTNSMKVIPASIVIQMPGYFNGLIQKLDYIKALGIDAIWLAPFQPTPEEDDGYDVADYYGVDDRLGSSGDFVEFMHQAEKWGIRVIMDLVINHTSDQHPWFKTPDKAKPLNTATGTCGRKIARRMPTKEWFSLVYKLRYGQLIR